MYKLSKKIRRHLVLLCGIELVIIWSFCMPWVSVENRGVSLAFIRTRKEISKSIPDRLGIRSIIRVFRVSLKNKPRTIYAGYAVPGVVWKLETGKLSGKILRLMGKKYIRFRMAVLYLYPVLLCGFIYLLYRYRFNRKLRSLTLIGCAMVVYIQLIVVGLYDSSSLPYSVYLDYGYWIGCFGYAVAGVVVVRYT